MTDSGIFATAPRACPERMRYAAACLSQGMSYQAAARASDVCEADLRDFAPGYASPSRAVPTPMERTSLGRCAVILPQASPEELGQIAALALRLLCEASGIHAVMAFCRNVSAAMPVSIDPTSPRERLLERCVDPVAKRHGITRADILGRNRKSRYAHPRQEAYWLLRQETSLSFPAIGRLMGGRDHTTIIYGIAAHEARMASQ